MGSEEPIKANIRLVVQEGGGLEATLIIKQSVDQPLNPINSRSQASYAQIGPSLYLTVTFSAPPGLFRSLRVFTLTLFLVLTSGIGRSWNLIQLIRLRT